MKRAHTYLQSLECDCEGPHEQFLQIDPSFATVATWCSSCETPHYRQLKQSDNAHISQMILIDIMKILDVMQ